MAHPTLQAAQMVYRVLSDFVVVVHFAWIVFMILGFVLTVRHVFAAYVFKRSSETAQRFFDRWLFRTLHLAGIGLVAVLVVLQQHCPLTFLENFLRRHYAPEAVYPGSFIIHYLERLVYPHVPPAVVIIPTFVIAVFSLAVFVLRPPQKIKDILTSRQPGD